MELITEKEVGKFFDKLGIYRVEDLVPSTCIVNLVESDKGKYVLKMGRVEEYRGFWQYYHLMAEVEASSELGGIEGLVGVERVYDVRDFVNVSLEPERDGSIFPYVLKKKYIEGDIIDSNFAKDEDVAMGVYNIVRGVHERGFSNIDVKGRNFVVGEDGVYLIDIGTLRKFDDKRVFVSYARNDWNDFDIIFGDFRRKMGL